ncbi:GNAT family N-acetyltransferase [Denitrobaculum tricleocarpae]|nr:GNAT family N-acetyltransferase [Denitrobaculum tricleocarpae]
MTVAGLHSESWQSAYRGLASDSYLDGPLAGEHRKRWQGLLGDNPEDAVEKATRPAGFIRLAEQDGALVGFIALWVNYKEGYDAYVENLHVRPGLRGGGIGRRLLQDAASCAAAQGCRNLSLEVLEDNAGAVRFYERLGAASKETAQEMLGDRLLDYRLMVWDDITKLTSPESS